MINEVNLVLTPTVRPFMRANPQMMFLANIGIISKTKSNRESKNKSRE